MAEGTGLRFNTGKTRMDLVPAFAQEQYAKVLTKGAEKYAERNWERGMKWSKVLASLERHVAEIKKGEDYDAETGLLHSAHIMCNAAFLTEYYKIYPEGDDRPHAYLNDKKIGLDVDEVLADWVTSWCRYHGLASPTSWYFDRELAFRFETMKLEKELESFYLKLKPKIKPEDIPFEPHCYVTSRPVDNLITEMWLDAQGFPARPVITVPVGASKVDAIKQAGVDIFVDDRFENFRELNAAGICTYLFDTPHNQRYDVGYKRIKSLKELV